MGQAHGIFAVRVPLSALTHNPVSSHGLMLPHDLVVACGLALVDSPVLISRLMLAHDVVQAHGLVLVYDFVLALHLMLAHGQFQNQTSMVT